LKLGERKTEIWPIENLHRPQKMAKIQISYLRLDVLTS
jgi:hypothetical protein